MQKHLLLICHAKTFMIFELLFFHEVKDCRSIADAVPPRTHAYRYNDTTEVVVELTLIFL